MRDDIKKMLIEENELNRSKLLKMPVCLCVNNSVQMKNYKYDMSNGIKSLINNIREGNLEKYIDLAVVSYSEMSKVEQAFTNIAYIKDPELDFSGEESNLDSCFYTAWTELTKTLGDYRLNGNNYCKPVIILVSTAENDVITDKMKKFILEKRRNNAVYVITILVDHGGNMDIVEMVKPVSDRVLKGYSNELPEILSAITENMEHQSRSSTSSAYEELLDPRQQGSWSRFLI